MRWIAALVVVVFMSCSSRAEDAVYYVQCRIWDGIPRCGPLHHACVCICGSDQMPYCVDNRGRKVANPNVSYYGVRPGCPGFSPEKTVVEITIRRVDVPPDIVRQRLKAYDGRWTPVKNCQTTAHWAVQQPDARTIWSWLLKK